MVARVTLPGGPLTHRSALELVDVVDELVEDRSVRVVMVGTTSEDFCVGAAPDLNPLGIGVDPAAALARLRVPVIAGIQGRCESVGLEIVLACDIRVASPEASFSMADLGAGRLPCWGGTQRLPRVVGSGHATLMLFTGHTHDGRSAASVGLVHQLSDDVSTAVGVLVDELLAVGPLALELAKEAVHRGSELPLRDGLRLEGDLNHLLQATEDRAEGLNAFFEKRPPDFAGR